MMFSGSKAEELPNDMLHVHIEHYIGHAYIEKIEVSHTIEKVLHSTFHCLQVNKKVSALFH